MRDEKLSAAVRALALGFTLLAFASSPAYAQSNNNNGAAGGSNTNATANNADRRDDRRDDRRETRGDRDDDTDWGWLGLLGLGGLLGLMPRKRVPVVHESRDVPGRGVNDVRDRDPRDRR
ncbi:MAG TPA: WGxxGxxG family protein [Pyrinomonadaceae bacterium]|nr:WGxxGxxG family protein [Pyrinomonadaceae bacterium]